MIIIKKKKIKFVSKNVKLTINKKSKSVKDTVLFEKDIYIYKYSIRFGKYLI